MLIAALMLPEGPVRLIWTCSRTIDRQVFPSVWTACCCLTLTRVVELNQAYIFNER